jgi:hypothetical protein
VRQVVLDSRRPACAGEDGDAERNRCLVDEDLGRGEAMFSLFRRAVNVGEPPACDHAHIARFIVTIEGPGWTDVQDVELPRLPDVGESLETKFGTMLVAQAEEAPDLVAYAGRIVCRFS